MDLNGSSNYVLTFVLPLLTILFHYVIWCRPLVRIHSDLSLIFYLAEWLTRHCDECEHVVAKVENRKSLWIRLLLTSKEFEVWKSSKMLASRLHTYGGPHSIWTASYSWQYTTQCSKNWKSAGMYVCTSTFLEVVVTM